MPHENEEQVKSNLKPSKKNFFYVFNPIPGGGAGKNALEHLFGLITQKPTKRETYLWSLNSSLSVTVTLKKKLALYVPRFNSDGPRKSEVSHFQIAKF